MRARAFALLCCLLLGCPRSAEEERAPAAQASTEAEGAHNLNVAEGTIYFDGKRLPLGSRLDEWIDILGAPDGPPARMVKWSEHGLVALTQGNVCGKQWVLTAEIWFDQGHEEPSSDLDIPYFDGRVVLEGTPIEPKKRYTSGWLKIGSGKHGCRGLKGVPFDHVYSNCTADQLAYSIALYQKRPETISIHLTDDRHDALIDRHGLGPAPGWFEVAREKGWCAKDPYNPTVIPKGPSPDWKPEDDLPYREKLRRGIVDQ